MLVDGVSPKWLGATARKAALSGSLPPTSACNNGFPARFQPPGGTVEAKQKENTLAPRGFPLDSFPLFATRVSS